MRKFWIVASVLAVAGCGAPGGTSVEEGTAADSSATTASAPMDLANVDLPLLWTPPDAQLLDGAAPAVQWKEETGRVEITAGEHFGLAITEEPGDMPRLKAQLEADLVQKHTIIQESPELLIYRSSFPDDPSLVFIHFYQVWKVGERTFTAQDLDGQRYNEQDIARMAASLAAKQPA